MLRGLILRVLRREHLTLIRRAQWVPERHLCLLGKPLRLKNQLAVRQR